MYGAQYAVFQSAQREVGFGEEIARSACRVEEGECGHALLQLLEQLYAPPQILGLHYLVVLPVQVVEKERVDYAVYVLDAGVVHASAAPCLGVERALEHSAEDGGRNGAPVEVERGMLEQHVAQTVGEGRHVDVLGKQSAVGVGECHEAGVEEAVALLWRSVERDEELLEPHGHVGGRKLRKEIVELIVHGKDAGILGIEAEHDAHAQNVELAQVFGSGLRAVGREQCVVDACHDGTCLEAHLLLAAYVLVAPVGEEAKSVEVVFKVGEQNVLRLVVRMFKVVDVELGKVGDDNPSRTLGVGHVCAVALRLLNGLERRAVALAYGLAQTFAQRFLLYHNVGGRYDGIDKRGAVEHYLLLEAYVFGGLLHAKDVGEQVEPEALALALLVAAPLPTLCKCRCRRFLLFLCEHIVREVLVSRRCKCIKFMRECRAKR